MMNGALRENKKEDISQFIDFDKKAMTFYENLYLRDQNVVVKIPIESQPEYKIPPEDLKIEKFDIVKYTYLTSINQ
ncbi:MAG: hypothetical protein P8Y97_03545 [Candidatus Lokiarchaeota archaeon]